MVAEVFGTIGTKVDMAHGEETIGIIWVIETKLALMAYCATSKKGRKHRKL